MCRKLFSLIAFLFLLFSICFPVHADDQTVFGPENFEISRWHVHLSRHSYDVDKPGDGVLIISKNTVEKSIRGEFLFFNGRYISIRSFLRGSNTVFEKDIALQSTNHFTVFLRGTPGASVAIEVRKESPVTPPEVAFSADPESIILRESSTLTWNVTNADNVSIDQGIGSVALSGSLVVSPTETTPYTLTAVGPGGTTTKSVTVTVTLPPPTVNISVNPGTILLGELSTLTWSSTHADTCVIEPDIGSVDVNGSTTVSPTATTTYTITATGAGGTATDSVTVTVLYPPTVEISADPDIILQGESSTLAWTSTHADTCVIAPDIGSVDVNSSTTVSPTETTTYTITASGAGGTATAGVTVVVTPIAISITSPLEGDTISRPDIMVRGTITNSDGNETGVVVNGVIAIVYGNQFVANHVPLEEGENIITATATDTDENPATASITINAETTGDYIKITADDESGVSPLETTLRIDGSFSFTESSITDSGPGVVEFLENTVEEYDIRMTTPGIYYFTAEVTDDQSNTYTDTVAVLVLDQAELDALLRAKWEGMRSALTQNDVDSAVSYFDSSTQDAYQTVFTGNPQLLAQMAQVLDDIQFVSTDENSAEYDIRATKDGTEYSFYLLFIKDDKGLWKIKSF